MKLIKQVTPNFGINKFIIYPFSKWRIGPQALCLQAVLSSGADAAAAHVLKPSFSSSLSTVLLQVSHGQPRFRLPELISWVTVIASEIIELLHAQVNNIISPNNFFCLNLH